MLSSREEMLGDRRGLIVDFDSIIYLSSFKYADNPDAELMYMDCFKRVSTIESEVWKRYKLGDIVYAITTDTNWRYKVYTDYKANRIKKDKKQQALSDCVEEVKRLLCERLGNSIIKVNTEVEADEICIDYSFNKNYIVACMDSDVYKSSRTNVFNYHKKNWCWLEPNSIEDIYRYILITAMTGKSKENLKGIKGTGIVTATKFVDSRPSLQAYVDKFSSPDDCLLQVQLVSQIQYMNGELVKHTMADIGKMLVSIFKF